MSSSYEKIYEKLFELLIGDLCSSPDYTIKTLGVDFDATLKDLIRSAGLYVIYWCNIPIYAGKSEVKLRKRIRKHYNSLSEVIDVSNVTCRLIKIPEILLIPSLEVMLIKHLGNPILNGTDFGNNTAISKEKMWPKVLEEYIGGVCLTT